MITVKSFDHMVIRVKDLERALGFYRDLLGLPVLGREDFQKGEKPFVSVRAGNQLIDLVPDSTYDSAAASSASGFLHFCLTIEKVDFTQLIAFLRARGIEVLQDEPAIRRGASGEGLSIYVRDPDGYIVEIKEQ